jgi:hypothetical protein
MHGSHGHRLQLQTGAPATEAHGRLHVLLARRPLSICYIHLVTLSNEISGFIDQEELMYYCSLLHVLRYLTIGTISIWLELHAVPSNLVVTSETCISILGYICEN